MYNNLITDNIYSLYKLINSNCDGQYYNNIQYEVVKNDKYIFPNSIFNIKTDSTNDEILFHKLQNLIKINEYPNKLIAVLQNITPHFIELFLNEGYNIEIQNGMIIDLDEIIDVNTNIIEVNEISYNELEEWGKITSECFFDGKLINIEQLRIIFNIPQIKLWIAKSDGEFLGASMTYTTSDVVGLHFVGVPQKSRNKGIGKLISSIPLYYYKQLGYKYGVLRASKLGYPVYCRIGFKESLIFAIIS